MHVLDRNSRDIHVPPHRAGTGSRPGHECPRNLRPEHGCSGRSSRQPAVFILSGEPAGSCVDSQGWSWTSMSWTGIPRTSVSRPTGPAPDPVPGMDALETCVRSTDAPDDQCSGRSSIDLAFLRVFVRFALSRFLRFFLSCGDLGPSYSSLSRTFRPASVAEDSMARKFSPLTTNTARFPRSRMQPYASETFSPDFSSALAS